MYVSYLLLDSTKGVIEPLPTRMGSKLSATWHANDGFPFVDGEPVVQG